MATKIIVLFNLKAGVSVENYESWAKSVDLPGVNALQSVDNFSVLKATGLLGSESSPPYEYIEIIDIADMNLFGKEVETDKMKAVAAAFQEFAESPAFILTSELG